MIVGSVSLMVNSECVRFPDLREGRLTPAIHPPRAFRRGRWFNDYVEWRMQIGVFHRRAESIENVEIVAVVSYIDVQGMGCVQRIGLGSVVKQHIAAMLIPLSAGEVKCFVGVIRRPYPPMSPQVGLLHEHVLAMLLHDIGPCSVALSELQNTIIGLPFYKRAIDPHHGSWLRFMLEGMKTYEAWHCFKYSAEDFREMGMVGNPTEHRVVHRSFLSEFRTADAEYAERCREAREQWRKFAGRTLVGEEILAMPHYNVLARTNALKLLQVFGEDPHLMVLFDKHHPIKVQRRLVIVDGGVGTVPSIVDYEDLKRPA